MTAAARAAEQDRAAGGQHRRAVDVGQGRFARASIALRLYQRTRRIRAYLRWSDDGRTRERYVGEVDGSTRAANLRQAWAAAWALDLLTEEPVPAGSWASSRESRAVMAANKGRDTVPELLLRKALHRQGLRYRVSARPLAEFRRTADVVFTKARVAVFVDGCFWHGCPEHHRPATKQHSGFWSQKIEGNRARDKETNDVLQEAGWTVIRVWEHEDPVEAARRITEVVRSRTRGSGT
ncbi:very short patch repair endonuclease [Streptomyces cacaoi]|uniref:very short patch repair endonuclease n=1 Tax=Streptomyces cacaoi TaxID=1898 RepID=UPI0026259944|nr:very short patch repair endonuclease [Streptomyces cacaoi]